VTGGGSATPAGQELVEHPEQNLARTAPDGFAIGPESGSSIRVCRDGEAWRVEGPGPVRGWMLTRGSSPGERFLLRAADGETEVGRSSTLEGAGSSGVVRDLILADGRVFRLVLRGPVDARFELSGWETSGAFLTARPTKRGWTITPEPASAGIRDIRPLLILFSAEILDSEAPAEEKPDGGAADPEL
jgi:hypothetical protein